MSRHDAADAAFDLAIVGGGPAGLAGALAATRAAPSWRVLWVRDRRDFGPAYATASPLHRLNVPVERMGLDPAEPAGFHAWLQARDGAAAPAAGSFVPRGDYGAYLQDLARGLPVSVCATSGVVEALRHDGDAWALQWHGAADGTRHARRAHRVLLAFGLPGQDAPANAPPQWITDPWAWWLSLPEGAVLPPDTAEILVVGSGLTAVDMVLGLRARGFAGRLRVVSPSGAWPHAHAAATPLTPEAKARLEHGLRDAGSARALLAVLREFARHHPWRAVIDALRADTNALWASLATAEQRRVLRHAFSVWNHHRHRMAPDVRETLDADTRLSVQRGRIAIDAEGRVLLCYRGRMDVLTPALVIDCRGPSFRHALRGDHLLARLVREGTLSANALGTGVASPARADLAVIGAALFGERFETTAVPELRQQAFEQVRRWVSVDQPASANQSLGTR